MKVKRIKNCLVLCLLSKPHTRKISTGAPLFFLGVNHHNQTIIFTTAIISNEVERTNVWLLAVFGCNESKTPISVTTDDDVAMRNAIRKVFSNNYHRLYA